MSDGAGNGSSTNGTGSSGASTNGAAKNGPHGNGAARTEFPEPQHRFASLTLVPKADTKLATKDFKSDQEVRWCPGCGDYAILAAFQSFLPELEIPRENLVIISGIGCSSRLPYYVNSYGMHSIHGRAPAIATGLASSRPDLSVWVITGDGDSLSIGGNHLIHVLRRNVNIKILLFNNRIYGLTKGQYSPTSEQGKVTKSTPFGSLDTPFNPVSLALGAEAGFVARTIDSDRKHLTSVLRAAADHKGTAFVEIYQNCPIYNDDAFLPVTEPAERDMRLIRLADGEPIRFGPDGSQGLRFGRYGGLEPVPVDGADPDTLLVHDAGATDPSYAFALSRLDSADFAHTPIGVFRDVERPSYDELMTAQIDAARQKLGDGDLAGMLAGSDTWQVG
jgi:2-oxoglutarate ferredoxin oxidoreductase subunit beta